MKDYTTPTSYLSVGLTLLLLLVLAFQRAGDTQMDTKTAQTKVLYSDKATFSNSNSSGGGTASSLPRIVITGTAHNNARDLPRLREGLIQATRGHFDLVKVVIYENDSTDDTRQVLLTKWNHTWPIDVIGEQGLRERFAGKRTLALAYARNGILNYLRYNLTHLDFDYVLSVDMDEVNFQLRNVQECFHLPEGWAACCTNNYRLYYDLWALRTLDDWCDCDVMDDCFSCDEGKFGKKKCKRRMDDELQEKFIHIPANNDPIQVNSCFGGAALYDYRIIKQVPSEPYDGRKIRASGYEGAACEHVSFSKSIQDVGGKLYIQPKMLSTGTYYSRTTLAKRIDQINTSMSDPAMKQYYQGFPEDLFARNDHD